MIIGYIVENGVIESKQVLVSEQLFDSYSITEIFDDVSVVKDLFSTIDKVKTKVVLS